MDFLNHPLKMRDAVIGFVLFELLKLALPAVVTGAIVLAGVWCFSYYLKTTKA